MSAEQFFCAYCGYNSDNKERCSHCGHVIDDLYEQSPGFRIPFFGRLTLRLNEGVEIKQVWAELAKVWRAEEETRPRNLSQLERFDTDSTALDVYGADYMISAFREALGGRGTVEFQEISQERMPFKPPRGQPHRPPTVPRNKR